MPIAIHVMQTLKADVARVYIYIYIYDTRVFRRYFSANRYKYIQDTRGLLHKWSPPVMIRATFVMSMFSSNIIIQGR